MLKCAGTIHYCISANKTNKIPFNNLKSNLLLASFNGAQYIEFRSLGMTPSNNSALEDKNVKEPFHYKTPKQISKS